MGAGPVALDAGAGLGTELHDLDEAAGFARRDDHFQVAVLVGDEDSRRCGVEKIAARIDQRLEQVHDVVVVHQGVGEPREGLQQLSLSSGRVHGSTSIRPLRDRNARRPSTISVATSIIERFVANA